MNAAEMLRIMNRFPFEPFEVHLSDGGQIAVERPWQISTAPHSAVCVIFEGEDGMRIVSYQNITEVVTAAPT